MNQTIKRVNEEKVLFFDLEVVSKNKELEIGSREFELYRKKIRNKETDEYLSNEEVLADYKKRAALKMGYTKIVSIGVGYIRKNKVYIKSISGEESDIISQFCDIASGFEYLSGANILGYDLPMLTNNGFKYFDMVSRLPDRFITSGKKPWNLDRILDIMDIFRGTHYTNSSLDELCYHFDLPSSKSDLDGSKVSEEYWNNGVEKIDKYVKQDVFASINVFKRMRFEKAFETFEDKNVTVSSKEELPILKKLFYTKQFNQEIKDFLKKSKISKKDKSVVEKLVLSSYLEVVDVMAQNKKDLNHINEERTEEVKEFFKTL